MDEPIADELTHDEVIADATVTPAQAMTRRLAESLRTLAAAIVDRDLSEQTAGELLGAVDSWHGRATGPHRVRYYETGDLEVARAAFVDFSPISGRSHPSAVPVAIEHVTGPEGKPGVRARVRFGPSHEGPPLGVHGGVIAGLFDELLGHAQMVHPVRALTANLTVRYRALTPINEDLECYAQVVHTSGRRWTGRATCMAADTLTAEAHGLFVGVDLVTAAEG